MSPATFIGTRASLRSRARGAVLFIALIVLVAMTLAGIAIMRSVDTATLIAGNLAFKQGTVQSSDNGIEQAYQWLLANRPALWTNNPGQGYQSGYAAPVWTTPATWASAVTLPPDAAGNTISYQIHRMCNCADTAYNGTSATCPQGNQCALDNPTGTGTPPPPAAGESFSVGSPGYLQDPRVYYRITVRTQGPRSTVSYIQAMVAVAL
jgi:Tfp pilus assembly protein PilX